MQINKFNYIFEKLNQSFTLIFLRSLRGDYMIYYSILYCNEQLFYFLYNINYVSSLPNETGCVVKSCKLTSTAVFVSENFGMHINLTACPSSATRDIHELFHINKN